MGPPFLERGRTAFRLPATRSKVYEGTFGPGDYLEAGAEFAWPLAPLRAGGTRDLRTCNGATDFQRLYRASPRSGDRGRVLRRVFTREQACVRYVWRRADFPWAGIWEENNSRTQYSWNGRTLTRAVEFGVSPFPNRGVTW